MKRLPSDDPKFDQNVSALDFLESNCNVGFIDDGTNYWALRTVGASEELMRKVERCTSAANSEQILTERGRLTEGQIQDRERMLIGDLYRKMYARKDIDGRKRTLRIGEEYLLRYAEDDRYHDPGTNELLLYLKGVVPKMKAHIGDANPPRKPC
ncbi:MAG: hypothetical protein QM785_18745 [Pyrinomonadaceae bacterium]